MSHWMHDAQYLKPGHRQYSIQPFAFADNDKENWRILNNKENFAGIKNLL
jgi:hypothetical protein